MRTIPRETKHLTAAALAPLVLLACVAAPPRVKMPERPAEEEQLVDVPASTPPPPTAPAAPAAPPPPPPSAAPALRVLAVSAQPARVAPGQQTAMIINYSLEGVASSGVQVEELRVLLKDTAVIQQWRDLVTRAPGTHTSSKPLQVPAQAGPGIYTLQVTLTAAGVQAEGSGIFEVR